VLVIGVAILSGTGTGISNIPVPVFNVHYLALLVSINQKLKILKADCKILFLGEKLRLFS
jgi:hypothetical protein